MSKSRSPQPSSFTIIADKTQSGEPSTTNSHGNNIRVSTCTPSDSKNFSEKHEDILSQGNPASAAPNTATMDEVFSSRFIVAMDAVEQEMVTASLEILKSKPNQIMQALNLMSVKWKGAIAELRKKEVRMLSALRDAEANLAEVKALYDFRCALSAPIQREVHM